MTVQITMISQLSGQTNTMDLPITQEDLDNWKSKQLLIQDAFPGLTASQREFLLTGSTQEEWDAAFLEEEEEEEDDRA